MKRCNENKREQRARTREHMSTQTQAREQRQWKKRANFPRITEPVAFSTVSLLLKKKHLTTKSNFSTNGFQSTQIPIKQRKRMFDEYGSNIDNIQIRRHDYTFKATLPVGTRETVILTTMLRNERKRIKCPITHSVYALMLRC